MALTHPEAIASIIARPINVLASIGRPVVTLLSVSTDTILRLFGVHQVKQPAVTRTHLPVALVVDEFGDTRGLVGLTDVTSSIVGDLPTVPEEEPLMVRRDDGSWLMDGGLDLDALI